MIEPTKVISTALQGAAAVADLLITTEAAMSELPADSQAATNRNVIHLVPIQ